MAKMLTLDEMVTALFDLKHPDYEAFKTLVEDLGNNIAQALAETLNVSAGTCEFWGGGTMVGFAPQTAGQPVPQVLEDLDPEGDWEPRVILSVPIAISQSPVQQTVTE